MWQRLRHSSYVFLGLCLTFGGCPPVDQVGGPVIETELDVQSDVPGTAVATQQTQNPPGGVRGTLSSGDDYKLYDLGAAVSGDQWTISKPSGLFMGSGSYLVVLFDANDELLYRQLVSSGAPLKHTVRYDTPSLRLGITPSYSGGAGEFTLDLHRSRGVVVPAPQAQVLWLNFGGGSDVRVHSRNGISFGRFSADMLGSTYAGATDEIKSAIVEAIKEDYTGYNVIITTSDEGPPPDGPYTTVHFGGYDTRLLGLADNVDQYNVDPWQDALVYAESFQSFEVMGLSAEEMGQMLGNVASHEFGHLLGLFHTRVPTDLMDTTGTAWDLVADQDFEARSALEESVFPVGYENSPRRLSETIGLKPGVKLSDLEKPLVTEKMIKRARLRAMVHDILCDGACGTCQNLER